MMLTAREEMRALKKDKEWEKSCNDYEQRRQRRELEHSQLIAARQKQVAQAIEARERELLAEAEHAKTEMRIRCTEMGRQMEREALLSTRSSGRKERQLYEQHTIDVGKAHERMY